MSDKAPPPSKRLRLRRFTLEDVDLLTELDSDPEVMRFINGGMPTPREEYERVILPRVIATYETGPYRGTFAAEEVGTDGVARFVGWFHMKDAYHWPGEVELGYRLRRAAWGRGLATEGAVELIRHALEDLGEPVVVAATTLANVGSQAVMRKAGMVFEREFVENRWQGEDKRSVKYVARRGDWRAPREGTTRA